MAWVNLDEKMPTHPKVFALSDAAFRLHISGICYCNLHLTDGLIDGKTVPTLVPRFRKAALAELVTAGLWVPLLDGAAYKIHDFLQWNRSRAQVEAAKERKRAAGKKGAKVRWPKS
jgi:hypothetical protein